MKYSYRPLIGLIEASLAPVAEHEFHSFLPPGVWLSTCRIPFFELSQSGLNELVKNITDTSQMLSSAPIDLIVVLSMTGTCLRGTEVKNALQQRTGVPTITAAQCVIDVLEKKNWKRLRIASNFNPELTFVERVFFNSHNIDVDILNMREKIIVTGSEVVDVSVLDKAHLLATLDDTDFQNVDALLFDAPFFDVLDIWKDIEAKVSVPVLSVNQIVLYKALKTLGQPTDHLMISKYLD